MRRQEILLNLTLLVIIGALVFKIYEARKLPGGLDELAVQPGIGHANGNGSDSTTGTLNGNSPVAAPGTETDYAAPNEVVAAGSGGKFGETKLFRALLTPTPTPTPTPPPPPPTPDIAKSLGAWKLLGIVNDKALMEDVQKSAQGLEGAIWEMAVGDTKQVDTGQGVMKTVTLKSINNDNAYNPEVTFTMEDTTDKRNINLDTEPAGASRPAPKKK